MIVAAASVRSRASTPLQTDLSPIAAAGAHDGIAEPPRLFDIQDAYDGLDIIGRSANMFPLTPSVEQTCIAPCDIDVAYDALGNKGWEALNEFKQSIQDSCTMFLDGVMDFHAFERRLRKLRSSTSLRAMDVDELDNAELKKQMSSEVEPMPAREDTLAGEGSLCVVGERPPDCKLHPEKTLVTEEQTRKSEKIVTKKCFLSLSTVSPAFASTCEQPQGVVKLAPLRREPVASELSTKLERQRQRNEVNGEMSWEGHRGILLTQRTDVAGVVLATPTLIRSNLVAPLSLRQLELGRKLAARLQINRTNGEQTWESRPRASSADARLCG